MTTTPTRLPVSSSPTRSCFRAWWCRSSSTTPRGRRIDAAQASGDDQLLIAPRLDERYARYGVVATIERVGRFVGGAPEPSSRPPAGRIGAGTTGPGAALWVEVDPVPDAAVTPHVRELAERYKSLVVAVLQRREAWQIIDGFNQLNDPDAIADSAGYASYLSIDQKLQLLESPDVEERLEQLISWTEGTWLTSRSPTS